MTSEQDGAKAIRLMLAYLCIATERDASLERKVQILDKFGLSDSEIAQLCSSAVQSIRNARHVARKGKVKKQR